jgi:hypothetical protein
MKVIDGLLDYTTPWQLPDIYLFTGNTTIKKNGAIVMGRGAAKQVRDTYPGIDKIFGGMLAQARLDDVYDPPIMLHAVAPKQWLGMFRVKSHWAEPARIDLIKIGVTELIQLNGTGNTIIHMNYPGIGNGRLTNEEVEPYLQDLPDNVLIYK